ncbi:MAG TPA: metal-dependent hydrolase [Firmicutes bacterium]|mgnify:FL=1|jgi:L-ascorbate metabolism protein UlaG (beta-lactamase superfamily)|nr:metal-dependent hydrolase [Bacillota bacterium]
MTKLLYLGHSCFVLSNGEDSLIFDPYINGNPGAGDRDPSSISVDYVLVSHAHGDHLGDAVEICQHNNAVLISTFEVGNLCRSQGVSRIHTGHIGGRANFPFGYLRFTPALHGAGVAGGLACGFYLNFHQVGVYFAGDTGLFSDMGLLAKLEQIDYALLPIGDNYTMGPSDALLAAEMLKPRVIIPMHYNTNELIVQDPHLFKANVEASSLSQVEVMEPGQELELT